MFSTFSPRSRDAGASTKDRGHNPHDRADLNLRLVGSGGAEIGRSTIRKDWAPRNDVRTRERVQQLGCEG